MPELVGWCDGTNQCSVNLAARISRLFGNVASCCAGRFDHDVRFRMRDARKDVALSFFFDAEAGPFDEVADLAAD